MYGSGFSPRHGSTIPIRKSGSIYYFTRLLLLLLGIQLAFQAHFLMANPVGGSVVAGSANVVNTDTTTTITTSDRAVINWAGFSIKSGETTQFVQPSSSSAVLNRVTSGDPSRLMGNLQANGQVYLLNPNGVLIGNGAVVNVGSFLASTANIADGDFMAGGNMNFVGATDASIVNQGSVFSSSGDVFLLARTIQNAESGTISAPNGTVGLAAGNQFYLQKDQIGAMRVEVKADAVPGSKSAIGLNNAGLLEAMRVQMSADGSLYGLAINQQGMVRATGVRQGADGTISLIASGGAILQSGNLSAANVDGTGGKISISGQDIVSTFSSVITAAGAVDGGSIEVAASGISVVSGRLSVEGAIGKAGRIQLTGEGVALIDAKVSANGATAGGEVLVGGDYQGLNPLVKNASRTYASKNSEISADSVIAGNGGKVILWANGETEFHGNISAKGGSVSGDGGFVEISGKAYLDTSGAIVDTSAINGRAGTFLLDPFNVYITQDESDASKVLSWLQGQAVDYLVQAVDDALKLDDILVDAWDIFNLAEDLINDFRTEPPGFNEYIGKPYYVQASTIQDWLGKNEVNVYADQDIIIQTDLTTTSSQNNTLNLYAGRSIVIGPINSPFGDPDGSTSAPVQINLSGDFYAYPNWQGNVPTVPQPFPAPTNLQNTQYRGQGSWEYPIYGVIGGPGNFILGVGSSITVNGNFSIDIAPTGTTVQYVLGVLEPGFSTTAYIQGQTYLGGTITTTGTQLYSGPVTLMADTTIISSQGVGFGTQSYYTSSFNNNYINSYNVTDSTTGGPFSLTIGSLSQPTSVQFGKTSSGSSYPFQGIGYQKNESINGNANYPNAVFPYIQCGALQSLTVYGATTIDMNPASITTVGAQLYNGAVTLTTDTVLSSTSGSITFANTLNGTVAGLQALGLTAGTGGNVVFTGAVGGDTRLGAITISSANDVTAAAITAASLTQTTGQGTTTLNGLQNYNTAAGLNVVTDTISLQNAVTTTLGGVVTLNANNSGGAAAGTLTIAALGDITSDGAVNLTGANEISTAGDVTTTGDLVNYNSATTLTGGVLVNSTSGSATGGAITFGSTLNGAQSLGLTAGTGGNVVFTGAVGGTTRLGAMTISSANNVTAAAIKAASLTQASGQGITALNGLEDFDTAAGLNIVTDTISLQNAVRTTSGGGVTFNANNLGGGAAGTLTIGSDGGITSSGNVTLIGNQGVTLGGDILVGDSNTPANLALGNNLQTGAIHQVSGRLIVSGITTIDPVGPAGNVFLFSPENDFVGAVNVLNANGITLFDKNTLFLDQAQTSGGQVFQAVGRISTTGTGGFTTSSSSAGILLYSTGGGVTLNDGTTFNSNLTQIVLANEEGFVNNGLDGSTFTGLSQIFSTNEFLNFPISPNAALSGFYPRYNILPTVSTGSDLASAGLFSVTFSGAALADNSMAYRDTFAQNCTPYEYFTFVSTISNMTSIPTPGAAVPMYLPPQGAVSFGANIQKNSKASKQSTPSGTSTKSQPWIQLRDAEQI